MAQNNEGKWKSFSNSAGLDGPPGVRQNLNEDLQERLGDDLDRALRLHQGSVVASGWAVSAGAGLSVDIATGVGFVDGQLVGGSGSVGSLPASTANIKIYVQAGTPYGAVAVQWPASFGYTTGSLTAGQLLLALVTTSGSAVTQVVDQRIFTTTIATLVGSIDDTTAPASAAISLLNRLGMLARQIKDIIGGANWMASVPLSITALLHGTTGHGHTGGSNDGPQLDPTEALTYVPVDKAGDTMLGALTLAGAPTAGLHAATKTYADGKVAKAGDTMTGELHLNTPLEAASGGTGLAAYAVGDLLYAVGAGALGRRAISAAGKLLGSVGGVPDWVDVIPSGTRMLFEQDAAPAGWTRVTDAALHDRVVRIVTGARAHGGSWTVAGLTADDHAHDITHGHDFPYVSSAAVWSAAVAAPVIYGASYLFTPQPGSQSVNMMRPWTNSYLGNTGGSGATGITSSGSWRPLHRDVLVAAKN